jgi:hypothetical protein
MLARLRCFIEDFCEILRQKEAAIERVQKEIPALQFVAQLLADDGDVSRTGESPSSWLKGIKQQNKPA